MGIVTVIRSLEDMCDMMCDNVLPAEQETWIFTFGSGQQHAGHYVKIKGTFGQARREMIDRYGLEWSMQYSAKEWEDWLDRKPAWVPAETELECERSE